MLYKLKKFVKKATYPFIWIDKIPYLFGKSKKSIQMPDFLIVGLPKCGTWWLANQLNNHPDVILRTNPWHKDKGEVRYFSKYFNKPIEDYFNLFTPVNGKIQFEKSPDYCTLPTRKIRLIRKLNPDIKIIMMIRNPIDRSYSHAKMDLLRNRSIHPDDVDKYKLHSTITEKMYNYEVIIDNWASVFSSQVRVYSLDNILLNQNNFISDLSVFLGVSILHDHFDFQSTVNATKSLPLTDELKSHIEQIEADNIEYYNRFKKGV